VIKLVGQNKSLAAKNVDDSYISDFAEYKYDKQVAQSTPNFIKGDYIMKPGF
jgi:hypothetical protein